MEFASADYENAQELIYRLLEKQCISKKTDPDLFERYTYSSDIKNMVDITARKFNCSIDMIENIIYLIPNEDNTILGYSKTQLRAKLISGEQTKQKAYLANFVILVLIKMFFDAKGVETSKSRDLVRRVDLLNEITECLEKGVESYTIEEQEYNELAFSMMLDYWDTLKSEENSQKASTKEGFVHRILRFLEDEKLIHLAITGEIICADKFQHMMDNRLLDKGDYKRVLVIIEGEQNE